jgi:pimeloyl-ACP methyl ester carboxylesterase
MLAAHELGDPVRPPLVFLHALGVGTSGRYVSEIAPLLRRRVVGVDGAGYGGSPALAPAEYELAAYVPRVLRLLDELGLERTALLGHSWGGVVACHVAAADPEAGAQRLRAAIRDAEVIPIAGAGHDLIADAGPEIACTIADWLDRVSP